VAAFTLPGAKLVHEGQIEGRRVRLPVFLGRRPPEASDEGLREFYQRLLMAVSDRVIKSGEWRLCECGGWPDNTSYRNLVAWCWSLGAERRLVVVNLSAGPAQGVVRLPGDNAPDADLALEEVFSSTRYDRRASEIAESGLFIDLPAGGYHFFKF
jgi:hypothetical protein